jgi:hypothetical protein
MRMLTGTKWGASKKSLLKIYRSLIRSILDYGSVAYDSAAQTHKTKLDSIQYRALMICTGAIRGTAASALQNECGEMPLSIRRNKQQIQFAIKIKATQNHQSEKVLKDHWTRHHGKYNKGGESFRIKVKDFFQNNTLSLDPITPQIDPPWTVQQVNTNTSLSNIITKQDPPHIIKAHATELIHKHGQSLAIYTDGSKSKQGQVSSAFCIPE